MVQEVLVACVGVLGRAVTSELSHGPEATTVHRGVDAPREGVLSREAKLLSVIPLADVDGSVQIAQLEAGSRHELSALRPGLLSLCQRLLPFALGRFDILQ